MKAKTGKSAPAVRNVLLVLRLSYASHREILQGISQAVRPHGLWRFRVIDYSTDPDGGQLGAALAAGGTDGVIAASVGHRAVAAGLRGWNGPLVAIGSPGAATQPAGRTAPFDTVGNDDRAIGRCGAKFLESLGRFRSFGFAMPDSTLHDARLDGFLERLSGRGIPVEAFRRSGENGEPPGDWLESLPKPAAVMAHQDNFALDLLAAAAARGLRVPEDVAVVGVDNDEWLCETATPPLTSVAPDHVRVGELAARTLRRRFAKPDAPGSSSSVAAATVVERGSTRAVPPAVVLAERARDYIRRNATRGIGASDVVAHLGVSRSLAALRFREVYGESICGAILGQRIAEAKRRLRETDAPAGKIAAACGFRSEKHAMRVFKARVGIPMTLWRAGGR